MSAGTERRVCAKVSRRRLAELTNSAELKSVPASRPLPEMGRNDIRRTGTAVDDIGGDHYLEVLVPPI
jgi:hypothetical protein